MTINQTYNIKCGAPINHTPTMSKCDHHHHPCYQQTRESQEYPRSQAQQRQPPPQLGTEFWPQIAVTTTTTTTTTTATNYHTLVVKNLSPMHVELVLGMIEEGARIACCCYDSQKGPFLMVRADFHESTHSVSSVLDLINQKTPEYGFQAELSGKGKINAGRQRGALDSVFVEVRVSPNFRGGNMEYVSEYLSTLRPRCVSRLYSMGNGVYVAKMRGFSHVFGVIRSHMNSASLGTRDWDPVVSISKLPKSEARAISKTALQSAEIPL